MLLWLQDCAPPLLTQASLVNTISMETAHWQLHQLTRVQVHDHSSTHTQRNTHARTYATRIAGTSKAPSI